MYITISTGLFYPTPEDAEGKGVVARVVHDDYAREDDLNKLFFEAVDEHLPQIHLSICSEEGENLDFLNMITQFFNNIRGDEDLSSNKLITVDDTVEVYTSEHTGDWVYAYDNGYTELRVASLNVINDLMKFLPQFIKTKKDGKGN